LEGVFMIYIIFAVIIIGVAFFVRSTRGLKKRIVELNADTFLRAKHFEGLNIPKNISTNIFPCPDKLVIESKKGMFEIPNERIINYTSLSEKDITQIDKSVVGRAVLGGVLLGGIGAIVGGMSGVGSKTKSLTHNYFVINYEDLNGEVAIISFESNLNIDHFISQFSDTLNRSRGIEKADPRETVVL
jgi:hypothetical protein